MLASDPLEEAFLGFFFVDGWAVQEGVLVGKGGVGFTLDVEFGGGEHRRQLGEGFGFDDTWE